MRFFSHFFLPLYFFCLNVHISVNTPPIPTILTPFDASQSPLSNGVKITFPTATLPLPQSAAHHPPPTRALARRLAAAAAGPVERMGGAWVREGRVEDPHGEVSGLNTGIGGLTINSIVFIGGFGVSNVKKLAVN
jgi:hypothetical protein